MTEKSKSHYEILGIDIKATDKEIRRAYLRLAKRYHPDVKGGDAEKFKKINEAQEILRDPSRRREYDSNLFKNAAKQSRDANKAHGRNHPDIYPEDPIPPSVAEQPQEERIKTELERAWQKTWWLARDGFMESFLSTGLSEEESIWLLFIESIGLLGVLEITQHEIIFVRDPEFRGKNQKSSGCIDVQKFRHVQNDVNKHISYSVKIKS